ncbi:sacsin N-terminal ATP-binding-like domain-containing protein [Bacteroides fragilis]|uniref:sacsin N-terminal ATP-binding-like domain-containing protein n=1 Tax=Bacteroides fragilis TaxID=817 RepID=UPI0018C92C5B|nr:hypothetical protein [Bacteroides fragilis]MBG9212011.1 hypothetical protein [Bacteroides fragilis]MBG9223374.1 hypothetical protein [Bacteroides fragilis]
MSDKISAREAFDNATYKQAADKIRQILSAIRNNPASSAKRWVWELMQNAKDIPNKYGKVSVEIELISENELQFRHNGNPFGIKNITGLIRQVSSKDSLNSDEETTGKFGTGFICTHLLSDVIDVDGVLNYDTYRKFTLSLDRSGRSSEELMPRIKEVESVFYEPERHFDEIRDYEANREEGDYDTVFTYHLTSVEKLESAQAGLKDLVNTLPITLVTQSKKIKQVHVIDRISKSDVVYKCNSVELDDNVTLSKISINDTVKIYLSYITEKVALTIEVKQTEDGYELIKRDSKQPVLYRDFPLIGSEKFYFPYTLNGFRLYPTEKRDNIPLNGEDNAEAKDNRVIIEHAVETAIKFNEWLIAHNATNRYLLACSRRPEPEVAYDDRVALPWIKELQSEWRRQLLTQQLVETKNGVYELSEISVPSFAGYGDSNAKSTNEKFFDLLDGFYLGCGHLPKKEHLQGWLDVLRPEYATWNADLKYEKDDFLADLESAESVSQLCSQLNKSEAEIYNWLNGVYSFLIEQNCLNDFDKYSIIPNMEGTFMKLEELSSDNSEPIPSKLMDLYNNVMPSTINSWMLNYSINSAVFGNSLQVFALKDIIEWFNKKITSKDTYLSDGESYYANHYLAYNIIELYPEGIDDSEYVSYRKQLYDFSNANGGQDPFLPIAVDNRDLWREADIFWFNSNYGYIADKKTVENLSKTYFKEPKNIDETLNWLNEYIQFYRENSKGDLIKDKCIFPNQQLNLKSLNDLRYDDNIEEEFKDLADYALNVENTSDKYRHVLLHRSIYGYEKHNPLTLNEVYKYIKEEVFDKSSGNIRDVISKHAISIIKRSEDSDSQETKLHGFVKTVFGDSIPEITYADQSTGFNWGFAQEFYLKKLCKTIAESVNLAGLKELSDGFADYTDKDLIEWVDSLIEFLHSYKSKKYWTIITDSDNGYGIWLNQNFDFCRFQDIRKDENIPDELIELVANNKHVVFDYKEQLYNLNAAHTSYLETNPVTIKEVGEFLDEKIEKYEGDKQDKDFAALIFTVGKLCSTYRELGNIMQYYSEKKNALIVGSLGEGRTLDLVGSIIQHGDEKLQAINDILNDNTVEDLCEVSNILRGCSDGKIEKLKDFISKISGEKPTVIDEDRPIGGEDSMDLVLVPKTYEIENVENFEGQIISVKADQAQYAGLSLEEIEKYVSEAKDRVVKYFRELNDKYDCGYQFDSEKICKHSYSQLYGISDKDGNEIPIVVHSYKGPQYRYFDLNWYDWQLLSCKNSLLFVLTTTGLQCIPLYALPVRKVNIEIDNEMADMNRAALLTLAAVSKEYSSISFDFGNNMPHGFDKLLPFNFVPKEIKECVQSIKEVCDQNIPQISNMYNSARNIPLIRSTEGYSVALKEYEETGRMRDEFEAPINDLKVPEVGTTYID